jgi:hypothetical protein
MPISPAAREESMQEKPSTGTPSNIKGKKAAFPLNAREKGYSRTL